MRLSDIKRKSQAALDNKEVVFTDEIAAVNLKLCEAIRLLKYALSIHMEPNMGFKFKAAMKEFSTLDIEVDL